MSAFIIACMLLVRETEAGSRYKVLLVSMDGFRWDYINKSATPNFDLMAREGTRAPYINNTFITKTFPCHYSIATGTYVLFYIFKVNHFIRYEWPNARQTVSSENSTPCLVKFWYFTRNTL